MDLHITARHIELTPALADYARKKFERVTSHFPAVLRAQIILSVEKLRHSAEIIVHSEGHRDFRALAKSTDLYAALDLVAEKLQGHLSREKEKRVKGRRRGGFRRSPSDAPLPDGAAERGAGQAPLTRIQRISPPVLDVQEAISLLEEQEKSFVVFSDEEIVSVLYKRNDKTYGLLKLNS